MKLILFAFILLILTTSDIGVGSTVGGTNELEAANWNEVELVGMAVVVIVLEVADPFWVTI